MAKKNRRKKMLGFKVLELAKYINSNPEKQAKINTEHKLISNENKKAIAKLWEQEYGSQLDPESRVKVDFKIGYDD